MNETTPRETGLSPDPLPYALEKSEAIASAMTRRTLTEKERGNQRFAEVSGEPVEFPTFTKVLLSEWTKAHNVYLLQHPQVSVRDAFSAIDFNDSFRIAIEADEEEQVPMSDEEIESLGNAIQAGFFQTMDSTTTMLQENSDLIMVQDEINNIYTQAQSAEELARELGISLDEVYDNEEIYLELCRRISTEERAVVGVQKIIDLAKSQLGKQLIIAGADSMLRGMSDSLDPDTESDSDDVDDIIAELDADPDFIRALLNIRVPLEVMLYENIERVWGKTAAEKIGISSRARTFIN